MTNTFDERFSDVTAIVRQLSTSTLIGLPEMKPVQILANQIGMTDGADGMLKWALSAVASDGKEQSFWLLLPIIYAQLMWSLCYDRRSVYSMKFDGKFHR